MPARSRAIATVLVCNGCCCGHTEKGKPSVPKEHLESSWSERQLGSAVRLRFVDCLGPCDQANLAVVKTAETSVWLAGLTGTAEYEALVAWADGSGKAGTQLAFADLLVSRQIPHHTSD